MADLDPSAPLCVCETRGCPFYTQHTAAFVIREPMWRQFRQAGRRHRRRR